MWEDNSERQFGELNIPTVGIGGTIPTTIIFLTEKMGTDGYTINLYDMTFFQLLCNSHFFKGYMDQFESHMETLKLHGNLMFQNRVLL